jgi:DNA-binding beta-propeller fold protein YncE
MVFRAPNALASPDWSRFFVGTQSDNRTNVDLLDGQTGARQASLHLPSGLVVSAVSADGTRVALAPPSSAGGWPPPAREQTRIVVASASGTPELLMFDLDGNYEPDVFSTDNAVLFVLEYQPARAPHHYRVRQLELKTGIVSAVSSRNKLPVPEEDMRGTRHAHVLSPDGHTSYTLYTNQPDHLHSRDLAAGLTQSSGSVYAFVHVLSLSEGWAYCLDLPQPFGMGPAPAHAMALSPDGRWLYVVDRSSGTIALADTSRLLVRATSNLGAPPDVASASGPTAAAVGRDGSLFLSGKSEILVVDGRRLTRMRQLVVPGTPTGLGLSKDGQRVFVSLPDRLLALDAVTGSEVGELQISGVQDIAHVGEVAHR